MSVPQFASMVSFQTAATCLAASWNTNYAYVVNSIGDGTRDLTVNSITASHVTCVTLTPGTIAGPVVMSSSPTFAGNLVMNGTVTMGTCTVVGEFQGCRVNFPFTGSGGMLAGGTDSCGPSHNSDPRTKMHRSGTIVGYNGNAITLSSAPTALCHFEIIKNSVAMFSGVTMTFPSGISKFTSDTGLFTRGTYNFNQGDLVWMNLRMDTGAGTLSPEITGFFEVVFYT